MSLQRMLRQYTCSYVQQPLSFILYLFEALVPVTNNVLSAKADFVLIISDAWVVVLANDAVQVLWRCIIDDNQLKVFIRLRQYAIDTLRQELCLVSRYHYTKFNILIHKLYSKST